MLAVGYCRLLINLVCEVIALHLILWTGKQNFSHFCSMILYNNAAGRNMGNRSKQKLLNDHNSSPPDDD